MNKLILLRHGQSQWNLENRFTGWKNVSLTKKGETEAKKAGELLKKHNISIDRVFSSVLERANRTAEIAIKKAELNNLLEDNKISVIGSYVISSDLSLSCSIRVNLSI